ncbi:sulfotransferase [Thioalkalivibrio sp. ALE9]|uniref:sulfotransferase family protein n=1 Tax=Thioalkalivibrio sp. ALE9 TaxID=1158169 RepID=UPI00037DEC56|nr:sulfotransferase [Thioalkalivibrio sp. ALE9]
MLRLIGIGAQKAGTTWLHRQLARHPAVEFPAGKEVHFWDRHFPERGEEAYQALFSTAPDRCECDITPAYSTLGEEAVRACYRAAPQAGVVLVLRNPVERAWSSALMALGRAEMTIDEASDQWFIDHFRSRGSRLRGDYARALRLWRGAYGTGRVCVLRFEQIREDPQGLLRQVADLAGLGWHSGWTPEALGQRVFAGQAHPLPRHLRDVLCELYADPVEALAGEIDWDPRPWLE